MAPMRMTPAVALGCALLPALLLGFCARPLAPPVLPGCGRDTDCKGARVCEHGQCVDPRPPAAPTSSGDGGRGPDGGSAEGDGGAAPPPPLPAITLRGASPMFHVGWLHQGRSPYRVSKEAPRPLGRLPTGGSVFGSPAITDEGLAIFGSHDRRIYAVAPAADGGGALSPRWSRATGDLVWCSPALGPAPDGSLRVYVGSDDDKLYALDAASGAVRWSFLAGPCKRAVGLGPEAARCDVDGVTIGPDGTILLVADGAYALRPDGSLRWRFPLRTHCASAPAVAPDGTVYFGCQDGRLYALGPDGARRWDFHAADDIDSAPAVGADGTIYVGSDDDRLYALSPSGALRWALRTGGDVRASPAIAADGTVYIGSFDGVMYAVREGGTVAWTFSTADRIGASATLDADGVVLFGSEDDRLYAVAPDGKLLWSVLLDGDVDSTPAIGADGTIYVGSDDKALHLLR